MRKEGDGETKQDQLEGNPLHFDEIVSPVNSKKNARETGHHPSGQSQDASTSLKYSSTGKALKTS